MVNFKDLMLGNFVFSSLTGEILEVNSTTFDGYLIYLEGIPVTEELLLKIGFEKCKDIAPRTFYRYWDKEYRYKLDADDAYCNSDRKWSIHIDNGDCNTIGSGEFTYVHELQNLVRVTTGHSLPIEKEVFDESA